MTGEKVFTGEKSWVFQAFQAFITAEHLCEDEVSMKAWKISMTGFLSQSFQASMVSL